MSEAARSEAMAKLVTKLDGIQAGQAKLQESFDKMIAILAKPRPAAAASGASGGGAIFPNYGRSKGTPVAGASKQDLEFYKRGCERTLADPSKANWHAREEILLKAINAELGISDAPPPAADGPPPAGDAAF